jgi:hypothetical protein
MKGRLTIEVERCEIIVSLLVVPHPEFPSCENPVPRHLTGGPAPPILLDVVESLLAYGTLQEHAARAPEEHNAPVHRLSPANARTAQHRSESSWTCLPGDKSSGRHGGPT